MVPTDTCMLAFAGMVDDIPVCVTHGHSNGCTLWSMLDDNEVWSTFVDPISYPDKSDQTGLVWSGWSLGGSVGWRSVIQAGNKQQQWCNGQLIFNLTFLSMKFIRTKKHTINHTTFFNQIQTFLFISWSLWLFFSFFHPNSPTRLHALVHRILSLRRRVEPEPTRSCKMDLPPLLVG